MKEAINITNSNDKQGDDAEKLGLFTKGDVSGIDMNKLDNFREAFGGTMSLSHKDVMRWKKKQIKSKNGRKKIAKDDTLVPLSYASPAKIRSYKVNSHTNQEDKRKQRNQNARYLQRKSIEFKAQKYEEAGCVGDEQKMQRIQDIMLCGKKRKNAIFRSESSKKKRKVSE